jgi:DNA-binding transcriptional LysR family regulator
MAEIDALRTFLAVHSQRSFSRAARVLHVTQPAVSARVRLLERRFGAPLFERTQRGIRLSAAGNALLPYAERALAAMRDAENAVRELRDGTSGPVSLAVVGTLTGPFLTNALRRFATEHPRVDLTLRTARSVEVGNLVRRGDATVGLRYHRDQLPGLDWAAIGAEPLFVVCPPTHRYANRRVKSLAALREERWIGFPESSGQRETSATHVFGLFLAHGLGEVSWSPVDSLTAQKRLVEGGFGIALMPAANIREELARRSIRIIRVDGFRASLPVFVVTRTGGFLNPAAQHLCHLLATEFAGGFAHPDAVAAPPTPRSTRLGDSTKR